MFKFRQNYDQFGTLLSSLRDAQKKKDNVLSKGGAPSQKQQDYKVLCSYLSTTVYRMFQDLKQDLAEGRINLVRFNGYLRIIRDELTRDTVINDPDLHVREMIAAIREYGLDDANKYGVEPVC